MKKYKSTAEEGVYRSSGREKKEKFSIGEKENCSSSTAKMRSKGVYGNSKEER